MASPGSDGHRSTYDWEFLITYTFFHERPKRKVGRVLWDHSIKANPPTVEHADVMSSDAGVADMTMKIVREPPGPNPLPFFFSL